MTEVQDSQIKEKMEDTVSTNGTTEEKNECKLACSLTKANNDVQNKNELPNGINGDGDISEEKSEPESPNSTEGRKLNGSTGIDASGDNTDKKISDDNSEKVNGSAEELVEKKDEPEPIVSAPSTGKENEKSQPELQITEDKTETDTKVEPKSENDVKPVDIKVLEDAAPSKPETKESKNEPVSDKEVKDEPKEQKESLPSTEVSTTETKSEIDSKSIEKQNDDEAEKEVTSTSTTETIEKMEVDEPDNVQNDTKETPVSGDEKSSALSNPCQVVLVKLEENKDAESESIENAGAGTKRKRSSSEDEATEADSSCNRKRKSDADEAGEPDSPSKKHKKIKLDENVVDTKGDETQDQQSSPSKTEEGDSGRKSRRLPAKKESDEEQSPSTRRSSRSSVKNQASPEAEKSPSKRSRQSTPNSTPKKSVTPSPKSSTKKEADSADEKSANENDKTPQKSTRLRSNPKPKRSLELDEEEDGTGSAKRQRRSTAGKMVKGSESNDEEQSAEEEITPARKGRASGSKGKNAKSNKKATTDAASEQESEAEEKTATTRRGRKSRKSRASTTTPITNSKIDEMKALLKAASLRIYNYNKFWKDCNTDEEKADRIVQYLRDSGLEGEPTIENCKLLRKKLEGQKDSSTESTENARVTRSRRSVGRLA